MAKGTINRVILVGVLSDDPVVNATQNGNQVVNLNLTTTELGQRDNYGNQEEKLEYHQCVLFGKTAEIAAQYLRQGSKVYLEGRVHTQKWQDQSGQNKYNTVININTMQMLGSEANVQTDILPSQNTPPIKNTISDWSPDDFFEGTPLDKKDEIDKSWEAFVASDTDDFPF
jgi:single stranded DNA-binding protein